MKRIGLTQRVEIKEAYGERRDCLDQNWVNLVFSCGFLPIPLGNVVDDISLYLDELSLDGIILTGGNDLASYGNDSIAEERDAFEFEALSYCHKNDLPVLGICRGMQVLNVWNGGELTQIDGHAGSNHKVQVIETGFLTATGFIDVNSFHNFGITEQNLADNTTPVALSEEGYIEALAIKDKRQLGIMWHPERVIPFAHNDRQMIRNQFNMKSDCPDD